jgi:hypothetical protein
MGKTQGKNSRRPEIGKLAEQSCRCSMGYTLRSRALRSPGQGRILHNSSTQPASEPCIYASVISAPAYKRCSMKRRKALQDQCVGSHLAFTAGCTATAPLHAAKVSLALRSAQNGQNTVRMQWPMQMLSIGQVCYARSSTPEVCPSMENVAHVKKQPKLTDGQLPQQHFMNLHGEIRQHGQRCTFHLPTAW